MGARSEDLFSGNCHNLYFRVVCFSVRVLPVPAVYRPVGLADFVSEETVLM